jgi:hypothetical protein
VRIARVQKQMAMDAAAAQHRILPSVKIGVVIFPAHFCRDRRTKLPMPENLYPVFRGTEMRPSSVSLPENFLFPEGASKPDLDALKTA